MGLCSINFKEWRVTWTFSYAYATINKKINNKILSAFMLSIPVYI
jgi:hypothetical protein